MGTKTSLHLRVNGIDITNVKVRPKLRSGVPTGTREVVIEDPRLGLFSINDDFILETSTDRRKKWKPTTIAELLYLIDTMTADKNTEQPEGENFSN
jgi:hypothetical protein